MMISMVAWLPLASSWLKKHIKMRLVAFCLFWLLSSAMCDVPSNGVGCWVNSQQIKHSFKPKLLIWFALHHSSDNTTTTALNVAPWPCIPRVSGSSLGAGDFSLQQWIAVLQKAWNSALDYSKILLLLSTPLKSQYRE